MQSSSITEERHGPPKVRGRAQTLVYPPYRVGDTQIVEQAVSLTSLDGNFTQLDGSDLGRLAPLLWIWWSRPTCNIRRPSALLHERSGGGWCAISECGHGPPGSTSVRVESTEGTDGHDRGSPGEFRLVYVEFILPHSRTACESKRIRTDSALI